MGHTWRLGLLGQGLESVDQVLSRVWFLLSQIGDIMLIPVVFGLQGPFEAFLAVEIILFFLFTGGFIHNLLLLNLIFVVVWHPTGGEGVVNFRLHCLHCFEHVLS
jgi:hypothetical protein